MRVGDFSRTVANVAERALQPLKQNLQRDTQTGAKPVTNLRDTNSAIQNLTARVAGETVQRVNITPTKLPLPTLPPTPPPPPAPRNGFLSGVGNFFRGVGNALNNVKDRVVDAGRSVVEGIGTAVVGFGRSLAEGTGQVIGGIGKALNPAPLGKLFRGDFSGAWNDFKTNVGQGAKDVLGGVGKVLKSPLSAVVVGLQNGISAIQTLVGLEKPGRSLNQDEINTLRGVYGDSIDYSKIRIKEGFSGLNEFLAPHTVGNTIYLPKSSQDDGYDPKGLLVHETAHVWQYQNGGTDYIADSLLNQLKGAIGGGSRNEAYGYEQAMNEGKKWSQLNPEQQASVIEDAYMSGGFNDPNARIYHTRPDGSRVDVTDFAREAIKEMRARRGAA